LKRQ
jgi:hypothetical protein